MMKVHIMNLCKGMNKLINDMHNLSNTRLEMVGLMDHQFMTVNKIGQ